MKGGGAGGRVAIATQDTSNSWQEEIEENVDLPLSAATFS